MYNPFKKRDRATYYYGMKVDNTPDPQQFDVYAWQLSIATYDECMFSLPFAAIVELVKKICAEQGIQTPVIHKGLLPMAAYDEEGGHALYFPSGATDIMTVVHELAHAVCVARYGRGIEGHGPEYVGVYIDLLSRLRGCDRNELVLSAYDRGLSIKGAKPEWPGIGDAWFDLDAEPFPF